MGRLTLFFHGFTWLFRGSIAGHGRVGPVQVRGLGCTVFVQPLFTKEPVTATVCGTVACDAALYDEGPTAEETLGCVPMLLRGEVSKEWFFGMAPSASRCASYWRFRRVGLCTWLRRKRREISRRLQVAGAPCLRSKAALS